MRLMLKWSYIYCPVSSAWRSTYQSLIQLKQTIFTSTLIMFNLKDEVNQPWEAGATWKACHLWSNCICMCSKGQRWRSHMKRVHYYDAVCRQCFEWIWGERCGQQEECIYIHGEQSTMLDSKLKLSNRQVFATLHFDISHPEEANSTFHVCCFPLFSFTFTFLIRTWLSSHYLKV